MKSLLLVLLCAGALLTALPCRAQQPSAADPPPLLFVYAIPYGENALPLIVLGLEKPALKIAGFAKCVRMSVANSKLAGLVVQLNPADLKSLVSVMHGVAEFKADDDSPKIVLWFTTPDNKALGCISLPTSSAGKNLFRSGVMEFDSGDDSNVADYLTEKLHPK